MPKFALAAPGSAASQRIAKLEKENEALRREVESLRKRAELAEAQIQKNSEEDVPPPPPREFPFHGHFGQRRNKHPVAKMALIRCGFPSCGQYGHSEANCQLRVKNDQEAIATKCSEGWHMPHLHDSMYKWRCQWCKMHLHEDYVRAAYPMEFNKERAKERANDHKLKAKYTSRLCHSQ